MDALPDEIVAHILGFLDGDAHWARVALVSKRVRACARGMRWRRIVAPSEPARAAAVAAALQRGDVGSVAELVVDVAAGASGARVVLAAAARAGLRPRALRVVARGAADVLGAARAAGAGATSAVERLEVDLPAAGVKRDADAESDAEAVAVARRLAGLFPALRELDVTAARGLPPEILAAFPGISALRAVAREAPSGVPGAFGAMRALRRAELALARSADVPPILAAMAGTGVEEIAFGDWLFLRCAAGALRAVPSLRRVSCRRLHFDARGIEPGDVAGLPPIECEEVRVFGEDGSAGAVEAWLRAGPRPRGPAVLEIDGFGCEAAARLLASASGWARSYARREPERDDDAAIVAEIAAIAACAPRLERALLSYRFGRETNMAAAYEPAYARFLGLVPVARAGVAVEVRLSRTAACRSQAICAVIARLRAEPNASAYEWRGLSAF